VATWSAVRKCISWWGIGGSLTPTHGFFADRAELDRQVQGLLEPADGLAHLRR
jgi:hypothetical protein